MIMALPLQYHATLLLAVFEMFCFEGFFYGWAPLVYVLKAEGYFTHLCQINSNGSLHHLQQNMTTVCDAQDANFNLLFALGSCTVFTCILPVGLVFDTLGTRFTRIMSQ